jgi:hypothetical protein
MQNRVFVVAASFALMMSAGGVSTRGAQVVWSGLVVAENVEQPSAIPPELSRIEQTLKDLFGYNQFQVIGQSRNTLKSGEEDWLAVSKFFSLHVDPQGNRESGYAVNLQLYKEKEMLLETNAKLSKESPLVIKGPLIGKGQLLLVMIAEANPHPNNQNAEHRSRRPRNQLVGAWHRFSHTVHELLP